jgi:hypothetical protein
MERVRTKVPTEGVVQSTQILEDSVELAHTYLSLEAFVKFLAKERFYVMIFTTENGIDIPLLTSRQVERAMCVADEITKEADFSAN